MPYIKFMYLICRDAQEATDEPYLKVNGRTVWGPVSIRSGQTEYFDPEMYIEIGDRASIELWERDPSRDDHIGTLPVVSREDILATEENGSLQHTFTRDRGIVGDATYTLRFRVTRDRV